MLHHTNAFSYPGWSAGKGRRWHVSSHRRRASQPWLPSAQITQI
jgi:hypothetical protein